MPAQAVLPAQAEPPVAVDPLPLHWFQKDAVAAAVKAVRNGGRATVVAATGSGKTLIAAGCARRLAARGRALVLVPTIELLEQTAGAWSLKGGRRGLAVAACSRAEALESAEAGGRVEAQVTTQAARIADLVTKAKPGESVTVYATYASLERIVVAHQDFGLPAWDVVIIDEAHRTAGSEGKAWAAIHSDDKVPVLRRLYFTATPKIADDSKAKAGLADLTTDADGQGAEQLPTLCSMTDTSIYGETVFTWTLGQGSSTATSPTTASWSPSSPTRTFANSSTCPPSPTSDPSAPTRNSCASPCRSRCCARSRTWSFAGSSPSTPGCRRPGSSPPP
ncbi:DEAD/DEAH box helicase family protein [Kitasatospora indigofera]|uniref:DEAD/DEAH box helicase family protein n=1 Tax=Kitasatospora indigofera TaxID=67307 RepID=UPI00362B2C37